jgi:hypothetical protein
MEGTSSAELQRQRTPLRAGSLVRRVGAGKRSVFTPFTTRPQRMLNQHTMRTQALAVTPSTSLAPLIISGKQCASPAGTYSTGIADIIKMLDAKVAAQVIQVGVALLRQWIESLPGPKVLSPPLFSMPTGRHQGPVDITLSHPRTRRCNSLHRRWECPNLSSDPLYAGPITLLEPTTLRARAFKSGFSSPRRFYRLVLLP